MKKKLRREYRYHATYTQRNPISGELFENDLGFYRYHRTDSFAGVERMLRRELRSKVTLVRFSRVLSSF